MIFLRDLPIIQKHDRIVWQRFYADPCIVQPSIAVIIGFRIKYIIYITCSPHWQISPAGWYFFLFFEKGSL